MRMCLLMMVAAILAAQCAVSAADVALRYQMAHGEKLVYQCASKGNGVIQVAGRTDPLAVETAFKYVVECTAIGAEGEMTLVHRMLEVKTQAMRGAEAIPVNVQMPTVMTVISPTGRILKTEVLKPAGETAAPTGMDLGSLLGGMGGGSALDVAQFFGSLTGPGFPKEPVHPGSRWQDVLKLTTAAGQAINLSYTSTFLDYVLLNERKCARLQTEYEAPLDLSLMGGQLFNLTGKTTGSQIAYFDYGAGRMIRSDGTSDSEMTMSVPQFFGGGRPVSASARVRLTTSVVLQTGADG